MPDINRSIDIERILAKKSCLLLGPRQVGKSWLIRNQLAGHKVYNLLEVETYRALSQSPGLIRRELSAKDKVIVIDEIQKLPELLDEIQLMIEENGIKFLLTGSSARKLKRKGVNLLGGRARSLMFHPLVMSELKDHFDLERALSRGLIPSIFFSSSYWSDLKDYVSSYLREEIAIETAIRSLPAFSRFLDVAALCNSQQISFTSIGNDAQVAPTTVREYFQVLEDTLVARRLPAWRESKKRKAVATSKYYFFDVGVVRFLQGRKHLSRDTAEFGEALETYLFHELSSYVDYVSEEPLSYWRSTSGYEVDFILGEHTAIELKSARRISPAHLKGLKALGEEEVFKNLIMVSFDERERLVDGIKIMPLNRFLTDLWDGRFC